MADYSAVSEHILQINQGFGPGDTKLKSMYKLVDGINSLFRENLAEIQKEESKLQKIEESNLHQTALNRNKSQQTTTLKKKVKISEDVTHNSNGKPPPVKEENIEVNLTEDPQKVIDSSKTDKKVELVASTDSTEENTQAGTELILEEAPVDKVNTEQKLELSLDKTMDVKLDPDGLNEERAVSLNKTMDVKLDPDGLNEERAVSLEEIAQPTEAVVIAPNLNDGEVSLASDTEPATTNGEQSLKISKQVAKELPSEQQIHSQEHKGRMLTAAQVQGTQTQLTQESANQATSILANKEIVKEDKTVQKIISTSSRGENTSSKSTQAAPTVDVALASASTKPVSTSLASGKSNTVERSTLPSGLDLSKGGLEQLKLQKTPLPVQKNAYGSQMKFTKNMQKDVKEKTDSKFMKPAKTSLEQRIEKIKSRVINQVRFHLRMITTGKKQQLEMKLHPEILGKVKFKLVMEETKVIANFIVENETVKEILQRNVSHLKQNLTDKGVKVDDIEVKVSQEFNPSEHKGSENQEKQKVMREWIGSFGALKEDSDESSSEASKASDGTVVNHPMPNLEEGSKVNILI